MALFSKPQFPPDSLDEWQRFREMDYRSRPLVDRLNDLGEFYRPRVLALIEELVEIGRTNRFTGQTFLRDGFDDNCMNPRVREIGILLSYFGGPLLLGLAIRDVEREAGEGMAKQLFQSWRYFKLVEDEK